MSPDIERVIALQRLDSVVHDAERRLAAEPEREKGFDTRLESARERLASARQRLSENQNARREIEKEVAIQQARLSKFRDQLMEVKTNREYQAIQHEIEIAQNEVRTREEKILERMIEADDLNATHKHAEGELAAEQKAVDADRRTMREENGELKASLEAHLRRAGDARRRDRQEGARDVRARGAKAQRDCRRRGARRRLHDLPRPAAAPGLQHRSPQ